MASPWAVRFREILATAKTGDALQAEAETLLLLAMRSTEPRLVDEIPNLTHWFRRGKESADEAGRRRSYAMVIALIETISPRTFAKAKRGVEVPGLDLNQSLFDRSFDPRSPFSTGARYLAAAALRLALAMVRSIPLLDDGIWEAVRRLLTLESIKALAVVLAGWIVATVVGGPLGVAVNAVLVVYGIAGLWEQVKLIAGSLRDFWQTAYDAKNERDLDAAAGHFARALGGGLVTVLEVWLTHRAFRAVETTIARRVPTPQRLKSEYERALKEREARKRSTVEKVAEVVVSGARGEGMRKASEDLPTFAVVGLSAAAVVGTVALMSWAAASSKEAA